jgi:hypothetical protein
VDLLAVVLHEFGHGLGFLSLVDDQTGDFLAEQPDVYARNLKDETTGRSWVDMTPAERVTSSTNNGNVTWTGPAVTVMASTLLQKRAELAVTAPLGSQATYDVGEAQFGAALTTPGIAGLLVNAVDGASPFADACGPLTNGFAITGNIAVIDRGTCNFTAKAINAQDAGAIGVVIVNNAAGPAPGMSGVDQRITIPVVSVSQADGGVLRGQMSLGPVTALIGRSTTRVAGAHASGNVQLYAPNPYQSGSSISHFDVSATPNLLMEPAISSDLTSSLDLTRSLFQDLGWFPEISAVNEPPVASFRLGANYPNPFRSSTSISFNLDSPGDASISVFDVTGRLVTKLVNGHLSAGEHEVRWDGRDGRGRQVSPGIYFYRLTAGGRTEAKRMVLAG